MRFSRSPVGCPPAASAARRPPGRGTRTRLPLAALLGALACHASSGDTSTGFTTPAVTTRPGDTDPGSSGGGSSTSSGSSSTSTSTSTAAGESSAGASGSTGTLWDMGAPHDFGADIGCKGKIDFLFIISSHGTMLPKQQRLLESYPDFMAAIEAEFSDFDRHILVTDGDPFYQMGDCSLCADPDDCDPTSMEKGCGIPLDVCDKKLGSGIVFPIGVNASNRRCDLADGRRYITNADPDPLATFECVAKVGTGGAGEEAAGAMVAALQYDLNGPNRCNDGFLRDDALLVVTIIKDTGDTDSLGQPDDWIDALYLAKGGNEDAVFVLVITTDGDIYPSLCFPGEPPWPTARLRTFAENVKHGSIGSICAPTYGPFFADAVAEIKPLCDGLIPQ